jgi:hypothetical protein
MPKSNHYYSKYAVEDLVKEMLQSIAKSHPRLQLRPPRKNNKRYFKKNSWRPFSSLVPTNEKKHLSKGNHFSSRYGGLKTQKEIPSFSAGTRTPVRTSTPQRKLFKVFCNFLFAMHSWLKYPSFEIKACQNPTITVPDMKVQRRSRNCPCLHLCSPRENGKSFFGFFIWQTIPSLIYTHEKKNFKRRSFLLHIWRFKNSRKYFPASIQTLNLRPHFRLPKKIGKSFLQCFFCNAFLTWIPIE